MTLLGLYHGNLRPTTPKKKNNKNKIKKSWQLTRGKSLVKLKRQISKSIDYNLKSFMVCGMFEGLLELVLRDRY